MENKPQIKLPIPPSSYEPVGLPKAMKEYKEKQPKPQIRSSSYNAGGFTLVELLVIIGIVGTLVAMLLPALDHARKQRGEKTNTDDVPYVVSIYRPSGELHQKNFIKCDYYKPRTKMEDGVIFVEYYDNEVWNKIYAPHGWHIDFQPELERHL